jgi:AcrR family transcriptional regulator
MSTTRAEQAEQTRDEVLRTARRLFAERGYDGTSLQQIADTMGVTKANVYYYFRTKEALLQALLDPFVRALTELLDRAEQIPDVQERRMFLIEGRIATVVESYRTLGPLHLGDPGMRRNVEITRAIDDLAQRGLQLAFGDRPTPDQIASYWILNDLAPALRRLAHLPDNELRATLVRLTVRTLGL